MPPAVNAAYPWYRLVQMSGDEGTRWLRDYGRANPQVDRIMAAVPLLRRGDQAGGEALLARAWEGMGGLEWEDPSARAVAERWYYGALGYALYCRRAYDEADEVMVRACDAMAHALRDRPFLLAIADEVVELVLHRARIARNRHRWDEMKAHVDTATAMREGTRPYYALDGGRTVWLADVQAFLDALPVPEDDRPVLPHLQRDAERRQDTDRCVRDVLRLPGFVIQHP